MLIALWITPLIGALAIWAFGPLLREKAAWLGTVVILFAFVTAAASFGLATAGNGSAPGHSIGLQQTLVTWAPGWRLGLMLDPLSLLWALIITGVGFLIHLYSIGYMDGDKAVARFFAYLNFFVFAMLTLVMSDNFIGLLVGWGLVGLASFFLIGYYTDRPSAVAAAKKAFVINVFGDVGLMFAIFVIFATVGSVTYADTFANVGRFGPSLLFLACFGIFIGCAAKSAQVPLHTWLPDAMEGPTPVSALIHAATMVTAGVYLIARCWPMFDASPSAQEMVGIVGAVTALAGAILGVVQWDIKRILAYSTMSQIGYMIMGVGVGAYEAGVLHFFTHAFFKAQLFLGAGLIIHALGDEQDVRKMGGLRKKLPFAFIAMLTGTLAICGIPPFSGYFSKDAIIEGALAHGHPVLFAIGVLVAGITAFYMFRMLFIVFFGSDRTEVHEGHHGHAPAWLTAVPVATLIVPTVGAGLLSIGRGDSIWARFIGPVFEGAKGRSVEVSDWRITALVLVVVIAGIVLASLRYVTGASVRKNDREVLATEAARTPAVLANAYYVDAAIDAAIVRPARAIGDAFARFIDPNVIDAGVKGVVAGAVWLGYEVRTLQTGLLRGYALTVVLGVACVLGYFVWLGAAR
jgi:NADH-quinone oxidoreductase subunit L